MENLLEPVKYKEDQMIAKNKVDKVAVVELKERFVETGAETLVENQNNNVYY